MSGHAKLPQDAAARAIYEILAIVVAVDPATGVIVDADSTLVTRPAKEYLEKLLIGVSLSDPPSRVLDAIQDSYWGGAKKAVAAAVRDLYDRWEFFVSSHQS